jgi:hypothetical protein
MKKIVMTGLALLALFSARAQQQQDSTAYKSQKLRIEEVNLVSSYYHQDGDNSAVTGGVGTEKLTDIANTLDVKVVKYGANGIKHSFDGEIGIDHYTSASSDKIDLSANSSASSADVRVYPSLTYTRENEKKGVTLLAGVSSSTEFDYQSFGANVGFGKKTKDGNGEFTAKFQAYLDQLKLITPTELRTGGGYEEDDYGTASRNTYALSLGYSQIVNRNFQVAFIVDLVRQNGYLSLPFHRVYFADNSVHQENLPDTRFKVPVGVRASYFLGDYVILRAYYRYYADDWGLKSHTANLEVPVKLTNTFSVSPFYRYYTQTAVKYFAAKNGHTGSEEFYTSNYDLSGFNSNFLGMGLKWTPLKGIFGISQFNTLELRYGHYDSSRNLVSDIISINLKFR